jgi:mono/diheme cytochrome c family protein
MRAIAAASLALLAVAALAGCDRMANQRKQLPYEFHVPTQQSDPDALPPEGVVARDEAPPPAPPAVSEALLERGRQRFNIYCAPCHGRTGEGNGMVVQRGFPTPPSYLEDRLLKAPSQRFYDVITHGYGAMYSYADRVAPEDRWAIVAYIRALQLSGRAALADLPPGARGPLQ